MNKKTPITVFVYNRPRHLRQLFDSLLQCSRLNECDVYIYCDGVKKPEHEENVELARKVVYEYAVRFNANIVERTENQGLSHSIVSGVSDLCSKYGRVIVLEDDFILHPAFLNFMLQALDRYENDERVAQVAGFTFPIQAPPHPDSFFLPLTTSWGWATWERAWKSFSWDVQDAINRLSEEDALRRRFDLDNAYSYYDMLRQTAEGKVDSWAIRWYWNTFIQGKLTLYPRQSLVWQNGFDELATHTRKVADGFQLEFDRFLRTRMEAVITFPTDVKANDNLLIKVKRNLRPKKESPLTWLSAKLNNFLSKLAL